MGIPLGFEEFKFGDINIDKKVEIERTKEEHEEEHEEEEKQKDSEGKIGRDMGDF